MSYLNLRERRRKRRRKDRGLWLHSLALLPFHPTPLLSPLEESCPALIILMNIIILLLLLLNALFPLASFGTDVSVHGSPLVYGW